MIDESVFENATVSDWLHEGMTQEQIAQNRIRAKVLVILQDFRQEHGYTQRQLAKMLGVTRRRVSLWENAEENIKPRALAKIAAVTGVVVETYSFSAPDEKQLGTAILAEI